MDNDLTLDIRNRISSDGHVPDTCTISVILSTRNHGPPTYHHAQHIESIISKEISREIITVHYNQTEIIDNKTDKESEQSIYNERESTRLIQKGQEGCAGNVIDVRTAGKFTSSIVKGIESSKGQFILAIDADYPYPDEVIREIIGELINSPNSIIIASRYAKATSGHRSFIRSTISKSARIVARHGLQVKEVKDPLSGCFALSSNLARTIRIEGRGDEILLEMLVKLKRDKNDSSISVKEVAFTHDTKKGIKKLDLERVTSYSKAIWNLYRYGQKSERVQTERTYREQKKHKSVLFLSKAGRFFTVGASGLIVNYAVSLLLSNTVPNIWYIHATFFGILVSISSNFVLNKFWTFEDHDFSRIHFFKQYGLFLLLCSFGAGIQLALVSIFVGYYHIQYSVSLIIAVCVASIGNFLLNKRITFGEKILG
jgi:dolichol-phosphate mannosyltransferase